MIDEILEDANERMGKSLDALRNTFGRIRTGRANPALLDGIFVDYYGVKTPLNQVASVSVEDARTLLLAPWERPLVVEIEKAILRSDVGITPVNNGEVIRVPLPPLTEENRRDLAKQAKAEAEKMFPELSSMLDKLAKKNIIHKNKAGNLKSKLAAQLAKM